MAVTVGSREICALLKAHGAQCDELATAAHGLRKAFDGDKAETVEDTMDTADMKEERRDRDGSDRFCCYDVSQPVIGPVTAEVMKLFNQKYFYI